MKKRLACFLFIVVCVISISPLTSLAFNVDSCMVTKVVGKIESHEENETIFEPVTAFTKLKNNDTIKLYDASEIILLFKKTAVKQNWFGPVTLRLTDSDCVVVDGQPAKESVKINLPINANVTERIFKAPDSVKDSITGRGGVRVVRSINSISNNSKSESEEYENLKKITDKDDITADLYMASVYAESNNKEELMKIINAMNLKWRDNPMIKEWKQSLERESTQK